LTALLRKIRRACTWRYCKRDEEKKGFVIFRPVHNYNRRKRKKGALLRRVHV